MFLILSSQKVDSNSLSKYIIPARSFLGLKSRSSEIKRAFPPATALVLLYNAVYPSMLKLLGMDSVVILVSEIPITLNL